jgi:predicted sulfurtransferase
MRDMRKDNCSKCGNPKHGIKWNKTKRAFYKYCKNCSNEMNRQGAARRRKSSKSNKKDL